MQACREWEEMAILDAAGELTPGPQAAAWAAHLVRCESCRREKRELERLFAGLRREMAAPRLSAGRAEVMIAAVHRGLRDAPRSETRLPLGRPRALSWRWRPAFAAACTALLVFAAGWGLKERVFGPGDPLQAAAVSEEDRAVISNLDLLENLGTIEKLVQVVDRMEERPAPADSPETQGELRGEAAERLV